MVMVLYFNTMIMISEYLLPMKSTKTSEKFTRKVLSQKQINLLQHNKVHAFSRVRENICEFTCRSPIHGFEYHHCCILFGELQTESTTGS